MSEDRRWAVPGHPGPPVPRTSPAPPRPARNRSAPAPRGSCPRAHGGSAPAPHTASRTTDRRYPVGRPGSPGPGVGTSSSGSARNFPGSRAVPHQLQAEPEPVVITPQPGHQLAVCCHRGREPLRIRLRHRAAITAERRRLPITEKLHRHGWHRRPTRPPPGQQATRPLHSIHRFDLVRY